MPYPYSNAHRPPAPVLEATIAHPGVSEASAILIAKVDTGADITTIPQTIFLQLQIPPCREVLAVGYNGEETRQWTYLVHLSIAGNTYAYHEVMATSGDQSLIGRDILNRWVVTLDGPSESLDVKTD
mgnify:CR=1 FL=1